MFPLQSKSQIAPHWHPLYALQIFSSSVLAAAAAVPVDCNFGHFKNADDYFDYDDFAIHKRLINQNQKESRNIPNSEIPNVCFNLLFNENTTKLQETLLLLLLIIVIIIAIPIHHNNVSLHHHYDHHQHTCYNLKFILLLLLLLLLLSFLSSSPSFRLINE